MVMEDQEFFNLMDEVFEYDEDRGARLFQEELSRMCEEGRHTVGANSDIFHLLQFLSDQGFEVGY